MICIFLITNDVEHLICLVAICISLEKCLFNPLTILKLDDPELQELCAYSGEILLRLKPKQKQELLEDKTEP